MDFGESAVTPVIGTILVLGISVAGIAATLFFGVPVIKRMQDQAALEATLGQFQQVRAETLRLGSPGASTDATVDAHGGVLAIERGTHVMVTSYRDPVFPTCDLRIRGWEDGDRAITFSWSPPLCRTPAIDRYFALVEGPLPGGMNQLTTCNSSGTVIIDPSGSTAALGTLGCLHAYRVTGSTFSNDQVQSTNDGCTNLAVVDVCPTGVTLATAIGSNEDWLFQVTNTSTVTYGGNVPPNTGTVYLEAWLSHMDRLAWRRGATAAYFEGGIVLGSVEGRTFLAGSPSVQESAGGFFLRLPTWQGADSFSINDPGSHRLTVGFTEGALRSQLANTNLVRLDFQGDLAQSWCNTFLQRSSTYREDLLVPPNLGDPTHACNATPIPSDRVRTVLYDPAGATQVTLTFVQQTEGARIEV